MYGIVSPCKGCENRHLQCWSECLAFMRWKRRIAETRKKILQEAAIDDVAFAMDKSVR